MVLKRHSDAQAAGDRILAVVGGSAVNHGGAASGLTVPNDQLQEALLRAALQDARVSPDDVDLIETHGTGTKLGDPIEVKALGRVFSTAGRGRPLVLGAVKAKFGHLEAAAGIIGLIKVVQCLRHETIPADLPEESEPAEFRGIGWRWNCRGRTGPGRAARGRGWQE